MKKLIVLAAVLMLGATQALAVTVHCEGPKKENRQTIVDFSYDVILKVEDQGFSSKAQLTSLKSTSAYGDFDMATTTAGTPNFKYTQNGLSYGVHIEMFPYGKAYMPYEERNVDVTLSQCFKKGTDQGTFTDAFRNGQSVEQLTCTCAAEFM